MNRRQYAAEAQLAAALGRDTKTNAAPAVGTGQQTMGREDGDQPVNAGRRNPKGHSGFQVAQGNPRGRKNGHPVKGRGTFSLR